MMMKASGRFWRRWSITKYSAVPIISRQGTYVGTITEGDLLWYIKNQLDRTCRKQKDPMAMFPAVLTIRR